MEPNHNNEMGASELPQPQEHSTDSQKQEHLPANPEIQRTAPATSPASTPLQAITPMPPQGAVPQASAPPAVPMGGIGTQQLIADDADLIEKEWVMKAKAIVSQTKDDPYQQNEAMTKVKADYLKKRYNKDLKVNEG